MSSPSPAVKMALDLTIAVQLPLIGPLKMDADFALMFAQCIEHNLDLLLAHLELTHDVGKWRVTVERDDVERVLRMGLVAR